MLYQKRLLPAIALDLGCLGSGALGADQKDNETVQFKGVKKRSTLIPIWDIWKSGMCLLLLTCEFVSENCSTSILNLEGLEQLLSNSQQLQVNSCFQICDLSSSWGVINGHFAHLQFLEAGSKWGPVFMHCCAIAHILLFSYLKFCVTGFQFWASSHKLVSGAMQFWGLWRS